MTLTGTPDARELPLYGSKCLAVREGTVQMVGQPKLPTYTFLAATAAPGDKSITIAGEVNWAVGDVIAIASSSFIGASWHVLASECVAGTRGWPCPARDEVLPGTQCWAGMSTRVPLDPTGEQTDEAVISGISAGSGGNTLLQLDRVLKWTHLGEVVDVPGDDFGRKVHHSPALADCYYVHLLGPL